MKIKKTFGPAYGKDGIDAAKAWLGEKIASAKAKKQDKKETAKETKDAYIGEEDPLYDEPIRKAEAIEEEGKAAMAEREEKRKAAKERVAEKRKNRTPKEEVKEDPEAWRGKEDSLYDEAVKAQEEEKAEKKGKAHEALAKRVEEDRAEGKDLERELARQKAEYDAKVAEAEEKAKEQKEEEAPKVEEVPPTPAEEEKKEEGKSEEGKKEKPSKEELREKWLKSNPSLISAVFDPNNGLSGAERARALAEILAYTTYATAEGARAGFNKQALNLEPSATASQLLRYRGAGTDNDIKIMDAKKDVEKDRTVLSELIDKSLPEVDEEDRKKIVGLSMSGTILGKDELNEHLAKPLDDKQHALYKSSVESYDKGRTARTEANANIKGASEATTEAIKAKEEKTSYQVSLGNAIKDLNNEKFDLEKGKSYKTLDEALKDIRDTWAQLSTTTDKLTKENQFDIKGNVEGKSELKASIKKVADMSKGLSWGVEGGYERRTGNETGTTTDVAKSKMEQYLADNGGNLAEAYRKYAEEQNAIIDDLISTLKEELESTKKKETVSNSAGDLAIEADGKTRYIVDEDGNKTELSPADNIVATTKSIEDIYALLGYDGGEISKDFDYYLDKLRSL